jgi:hypothetical protein
MYRRKKFMRIRLLLLRAIALFWLSSPAAYCGDTTGTISELLLLNDYPDRIFVRVNGSNTALPPCSTASNRYVLDSSTNMGKQLYALLLAAKHADVPITVHGFNRCSLISNSEDLRGVRQNQ